MKKVLIAATAAAITLTSMATSYAGQVGGDPWASQYVDSIKVKAKGTKGQTAHRVVSVSAGPDRAFLTDTLEFVENSRSGGGSVYYRFRPDLYENVTVPTIIDGATYNLPMPRVVYIELHAETGSGTGNYNRGAWLNGHVKGKTIETDR